MATAAAEEAAVRVSVAREVVLGELAAVARVAAAEFRLEAGLERRACQSDSKGLGGRL